MSLYLNRIRSTDLTRFVHTLPFQAVVFLVLACVGLGPTSSSVAQRMVPVSSPEQQPLPQDSQNIKDIKPLLGSDSKINMGNQTQQDQQNSGRPNSGQIEEILPRGGNPVGSGVKNNVIPNRGIQGQGGEYVPRNFGATGDENVDTRGTEIIQQRYPDGKVQVKRHVLQDEEGNYFNHGPWKLFNRQGQVLAEGQFDQGYLAGSWQRWHGKENEGLFATEPFRQYRGPFLSVAYFNKGKLHGSWIVFDPSRRKIFELGYQDGKRDGVAIWWYPNGMKMRQMGFKEGTLHGEFVEWDQQGRIQRRERYVEGQQLVTKTENWAPNQKRSEDSFLGPRMEVKQNDDWWNAKPSEYTSVGNDIQHGASLSWHQNAQPRKRGNFAKGMRQGTFVWWYTNGQKQTSGAYTDDQRVGNWVWWHENGMKAISGQYQDGKTVGQWKWWDDQGQLTREADLDEVPEEIEYDLPNPETDNVSNAGETFQGNSSNLSVPDLIPPSGDLSISEQEMSILSGIDDK